MKRRWYVIQGNFLHTFRNRKSVGPSRVICLAGCSAQPLPDYPGGGGGGGGGGRRRAGRSSSEQRCGLKLYLPMTGDLRVFYCETGADRDRWLHALRHAARQSELEDYYQIEDEIGSGPFSKVYRCRRRQDGHRFALKVIDKSGVDESLRPLLRNEVVVHQFVHHRNIVPLLNVFETPTRIQLLMPYVAGGDLCQHLKTRGPYPERRARSIFAQIVAALRYLHERGIVHRDLKLENVLIAPGNGDDDDDGGDHIQLIDFGLSKFAAPDQTMVRTCGTLEYAAPEILLRTEYGRQVDSWSAGVVLYALLSARLPFCLADLRRACRQVRNRVRRVSR